MLNDCFVDRINCYPVLAYQVKPDAFIPDWLVPLVDEVSFHFKAGTSEVKGLTVIAHDGQKYDIEVDEWLFRNSNSIVGVLSDEEFAKDFSSLDYWFNL